MTHFACLGEKKIILENNLWFLFFFSLDGMSVGGGGLSPLYLLLDSESSLIKTIKSLERADLCSSSFEKSK